MAKVADELAEHIRRMEDRVSKLRTIQGWLADDPGLAAELIPILVSPQTTRPAPSPAQRKRASSPHLDKVVDMWLENDNQWYTAADICVATGLPRNTVNALLYTSKFKMLFESDLPGPKKRVWRLKPEVLVEKLAEEKDRRAGKGGE